MLGARRGGKGTGRFGPVVAGELAPDCELVTDITLSVCWIDRSAVLIDTPARMEPYHLEIHRLTEPFTGADSVHNSELHEQFESTQPFPSYHVGDTISEAITMLGRIEYIEHEIGYTDSNHTQVRHNTILYYSEAKVA